MNLAQEDAEDAERKKKIPLHALRYFAVRAVIKHTVQKFTP